MDLKTFIFSLSVSERDAFARRCGTSAKHLQNVAYDLKSLDQTVALNIERETDGLVTVAELDPEHAAAMAAAGYVKQPRGKRAKAA